MARRTILHADLDAFYASVEQRDHPEWQGRPVVVGGEGPRGVVATASYEARRFGVHSAMPGARARVLCPDAIFVRPRMQVYAAIAAEIREVFESVTPLVEPLSLDEAFLDVTGSEAIFGDGREIAERLREDVARRTELTLSVGVATSKFLAKIASDLDKPNGLVVVEPGAERAFLEPLPLKRLFGIGPKGREALVREGIETIGEVARAQPQRLIRALGPRNAERIQLLAQGIDDRPVEPEREAKSIGRETTFQIDLSCDEELDRVLQELSDEVGRRLRCAGVRACGVRVKVRFPPFRTVQRQRRVDPPIDDDLGLRDVARELLAEARKSGQPVRLIGVTATDFVSGDGPSQGSLFDGDGADPKRRALSQVKDALRDKFGDDIVR